jgi:hypothetical protein
MMLHANAKGHYGHTHVVNGHYEGPRGGHYHYGNYGQRVYDQYGV